MLSFPGPEPVRIKEKEGRKPDDESDKEDFHRGKVPEKDFGGDKSGSPDEDGEQGDDCLLYTSRGV